MKAELLNIFGDDLMIVNAARVSYGKTKSELDEKDIKLLKYLKDHKHTSPFRHPQLQFRISCPIFVERQLFKHQIGLTANSISGRYIDFSDDYYFPKEWRLQSKDSKQGSDGVLEYFTNEFISLEYEKLIDSIKKFYKAIIKNNVSKEMARMILPLSLYTTFIWTGSLQAYLNLFELRLKPDAQEETRIVVQEILDLVKRSGKFEHTLNAWGY
jgi:thymidylate synthase (FAD)